MTDADKDDREAPKAGRARLIEGEDLTVSGTLQPPATGMTETSEDLELMVHFSGTCLFRWYGSDQRTHGITERGETFFIIPPGCRHSWSWTTISRVIRVRLKQKFLPVGLGAQLTDPVVITDGDESVAGVFWPLALELRDLLEAAIPEVTRIEHAAAALSRSVLAAFMERSRPVPRLSAAQLKAIDAYIEQKLRFEIQVADLAARVSLSPSHFAAVFKATTGRTPLRYLTERRLLKARDLLAGGELRVGEVARAIGYEDQGHFSAKFREHFGVMPRQVLGRGRR